MALRFYDPGGPNLLNGSSCCSARCLWNCFPWDVMSANVTVLAGLASSCSRKDLPLARGHTSEEMTRLCPASPCSHLPSSTESHRLRPLSSSHSSPSMALCLFRCLSPSWFSLARSPLSYFLLTLPSFVLVTMATAFSEWDGEARGLMEDTGAYATLAIHHCPALSLSPPLKSLSLSSLQLTAAGGKSCWTSARYMPSCCPVCPLIVYLRSKSLGLDSLVNSGLTFPGVGKHSESHFEFCFGYRSLFCRI